MKIKFKKPDFKSIKFKGGAYTTVLSSIVIVLVVVINVIVSSLNPSIDLTKNKFFTMSKDTKAYIGSLDTDITIYYLERDAIANTYINPILEDYEKNSKHINVVVKDPSVYPSFAEAYTDEEAEDYSVIVVNDSTGKHRYVSASSMLVYDYQIDYTTYNYSTYLSELDIEGQIDAAISYVTSDVNIKVYEVTGHGESLIGSNTLALLKKASIDYETITLLTADEIPSDCSVLLSQTPENDYTEAEAALVKEYLSNGGKAVFNVCVEDVNHANLNSIISEYGISVQEGIIIDSERRLNRMYPAYYFLANTSNYGITSGFDDKYLIIQYASALTRSEEEDTDLSYTGLVYTSSKAYVKQLDAETLTKEADDESGTMYIGYKIENSLDGSEVCIYSGVGMFYDEYATNSAYCNVNLLLNSIQEMAGYEESTVTVAPVSVVDGSYLTIPDSETALDIAILFAAIPVICILTGIVIVIRRRKRG